MTASTRIFTMSGVYDEENFSIEGACTLDFRGLEGTNCWCSPESEETIRKTLENADSGACCFAAESGPAVNWIDTGDYHYLSAILCSRVTEPFELVLLDNHPDDQQSAFDDGDILSCGNWVKWLRGHCPMLSAVRWIRTSGQLRRVYDYGDAVADVGGTMADPVYLSIDLDILRRGDFATDWDQGDVSAENLFRALKCILGTRRVLGLDICGGITAAKGAGGHELEANREFRYCLYSKISQYLRV